MARPRKVVEPEVVAQWFKVWTRWDEAIEQMTDEQAGRLLRSMMQFIKTDTEPNFEGDTMLSTCWTFMRSKLQFDKQYYINQVKQNREAGRTSAQNKQKKRVPKDGVFEAGNTDGTRDRQQVLTSVNQEKKKRRKKKEEDKGLSNFLPADKFDMKDSKEYIESQRAVNILKGLGEKLTLPKMKMVRQFIRDHDGWSDDEVADGVRYKIQEVAEAVEE
jgi:hypothetical protein